MPHDNPISIAEMKAAKDFKGLLAARSESSDMNDYWNIRHIFDPMYNETGSVRTNVCRSIDYAVRRIEWAQNYKAPLSFHEMIDEGCYLLTF